MRSEKIKIKLKRWESEKQKIKSKKARKNISEQQLWQGRIQEYKIKLKKGGEGEWEAKKSEKARKISLNDKRNRVEFKNKNKNW